ncbi:MAG: carboxypeptidase regulatory-like domain-containing protein, partial [Flavobacteriales bacterium]|nr:carboxypeptidase regulatory-like domain-containing protein [Flavobacteriales bacterium]
IFLDSLFGTSTLGGTILFDGSGKNGDRAGDPIPGVDISLEQIPGGIIATTETDSTGSYAFNNVPVSDSSYTIYVSYPGMPMQETYVVDVTSDTSATDLNFVVGDSTVYIQSTGGTFVQNVSVKEYSKLIVFPNPFIDFTILVYTVGGEDMVKLEVYNVIGEQVYLEQYDSRMPGTYNAKISNSDLGTESGIYIVKLTVGNEVHTTRIVQTK